LNYSQLQELHVKFRNQGLAILAFPCNQFGCQEPGTNAEIKAFAANYKVSFDIFDKVKVNGRDTHSVFRFLKAHTQSTGGNYVKWNWSKFLVDKSGKPIARFGPSTAPLQLISTIQNLV